MKLFSIDSLKWVSWAFCFSLRRSICLKARSSTEWTKTYWSTVWKVIDNFELRTTLNSIKELGKGEYRVVAINKTNTFLHSLRNLNNTKYFKFRRFPLIFQNSTFFTIIHVELINLKSQSRKIENVTATLVYGEMSVNGYMNVLSTENTTVRLHSNKRLSG